MTATLRTSHGTYTGRTLESIIRREYGRKAYIWGATDHIVYTDQYGTHVLATIIDWEGRSEAAEAYDAEQAEVAQSQHDHPEYWAEMDRQQDELWAAKFAEA